MRTAYYNFSGGVNFRDNVLAINELEDCKNLYWEKGLVRRKGCQTRNAALTYTGGTVNSILNHLWYRWGGTDLYFLFADVDIEEQFTIQCRADVSTNLNDTYFYFSTSTVDYYVWFDVDSGGSDPSITGKTGVEIDIAENDTAATVGDAVQAAIDALSGVGATDDNAGLVTVTMTTEGDVTDAVDVDSNQEVNVTRNGNLVGVYKFSGIPSSTSDSFTVVDGVYRNGYCEVAQFRDKVWLATGADNPFVVYDKAGTWSVKEVPLCDWTNTHANYGWQQYKREVFTVTCTAAGAHDGEYWTFTNGVDDYYVWYDEADASTDPDVDGRIGIEVDHLAADTDAQVATKTEAALQNIPRISTSVSAEVVTVTIILPGVDSEAADGDVGFAIADTTTAVEGDGAGIINNTKASDETSEEDTWGGCKDVVTQKNYIYITDYETLYFAAIGFKNDPAGIAWNGTNEPDKDLLASGANATWDASQYLELDDAADVTGMIGHEDFIVLHGKRGTYVFVNRNFFNGDYVYDKIGTVGLRGYPAATNAGLYGVSDDGLYGWDGDNIIDLGKKVWPTIQTSIDASAYSDLETCSVALHQGKVWVSVPAYNKIFVFDPDLIYVSEDGDSHAPMYLFEHEKNSSGIGFEKLISVEGKLFAIEKDSATLIELDVLYDDYEDDATNETGVDYMVQTAYLDQDTPAMQKIYKRAEFEVTANINDMGDVDIYTYSENGEESDVDLDVDTTVPTGQGERAYILENLPYEVDGHTISFKLTADASSSDGETIPTIYGFKLEYETKEI